MDFKVYLTNLESSSKLKWKALSFIKEASIFIETNTNFEQVLKNLKDEFKLAITSFPPDAIAVTDDCQIFNFLSKKDYICKLEITISDSKNDAFSEFLENAVEKWKGCLDDGMMKLLEKTFVSVYHSTSYKLLHREDFNEYLVNHRIVKALDGFCAEGYDPKIERYMVRLDVSAVSFIVKQINLNEDFLKKKSYFHKIVFYACVMPEQINELKEILTILYDLYPYDALKTILKTRSAEYGDRTAIEYACAVQADKILDVFLNLEGTFKNAISEQAWDYDVTNLIPDTLWNTKTNRNDGEDIPLLKMQKESIEGSQVSCLERIIASWVLDEQKAAKMLSINPIKHLINDYVIWSKSLRGFMFAVQIFIMVLFTIQSLNINPKIATLETCFNAKSFNASTSSEHPCPSHKPLLPSISYSILFSIWPLLSFLFGIIQFVGLRKIVREADEGFGFKAFISSFPFYDMILFILFILRIFSLSNDSFRHHYFEVIASIMILGWIRPSLYLSYTSYLSAFAVALRSSLIKYIMSFIFMFTFVYVGFSFSFKTLLTQYIYWSNDKPLDWVAYLSYVTLFGMGELEQVPNEMEEKLKAVLFLKLVICLYCTCTAVLVLAIIRQPDEELVTQVGAQLKGSINLKFLKDISWLLVLRKKLGRFYLHPDEYGSFWYSLKECFGFQPRSYRKISNRYSLILTKDELAQEENNDDKQNIESLQAQLTNIQKSLSQMQQTHNTPK